MQELPRSISFCLHMKSLYSVALVVLLGAPALAQTSGLEAGVQVGSGFSWLRGNKVIDDTDPLLGPAVGLTLQYDLSRAIGLHLGAHYQLKGMRMDVRLADVQGNIIGNADVRNELSYLMFPLTVRALFGSSPRFFIAAGPYAGFLMRSRETFAGDLLIPDQDNTEDLKQWDLGICAGIGASFPLSDHVRLNAELRYDKGLTNISALPVIDDGSIRTNAACLLVGCSYLFGNEQ